jgi:hypothetical protein
VSVEPPGASESETDATVGCTNDAAIDAASWTPASLPGLALWLNDTGIVADPSDPSQVLHWLDRSGNGNDATGMCANSCPASLPSLDPEIAHGHDAVTCGALSGNGTSLTILGSPSLQLGTGDWVIALVYKPDPGTGEITMWDQSGVLSWLQTDPATTSVHDGTAVVSGALTANHFQYLLALDRGSSLSLLSSTVSEMTGSAPGDISGNVTLCENPNAFQYAELAEVVAVKGTLGDADIASLVSYLNAKFALP